MSVEPRTPAGKRLLRMFETEARPRGVRWPRAFDARLAERIVQEFVPRIETEAAYLMQEVGPHDGWPVLE